MDPIIQIQSLSKTYASKNTPEFQALKNINLDIHKGEIIALLGPNGAGKTTMISIICGLVTPTEGRVLVGGYDIVNDYRKARELIGLVPQELSTDTFESVLGSLKFSRGLFGKAPNPQFLEQTLRDLSLWDKRGSRIMALSGGMKRRLLIAKALVHEPKILFLDEPTAGVDVELRRDMWEMVRRLRDQGVTIILTTHYIEEAEEMADRIGVINKGQLMLVEEKTTLMKKLGKKELVLHLSEPMTELPESLSAWSLECSDDGETLRYFYDDCAEQSQNITGLLTQLAGLGIEFKDIQSSQSSLEDIFVSLVNETQNEAEEVAS